MASGRENEVIYIEGFVPPLTVDKVFAALANAGGGWKSTYYENFLDKVLKSVGTDVDSYAAIEGFDVRDGIPAIPVNEESQVTSNDSPVSPMSPQDEINYLRREVESAQDMNARLNKVRIQEQKDNNSFFWAMVALVALITAGFFGFGK